MSTDNRVHKKFMCPFCMGFGNLWDRFTYEATECPLCHGLGNIKVMVDLADPKGKIHIEPAKRVTHGD